MEWKRKEFTKKTWLNESELKYWGSLCFWTINLHSWLDDSRNEKLRNQILKRAKNVGDDSTSQFDQVEYDEF